jgi:hypothetical protein
VRNHGSRSVVTSYTPPLVILRGLVRSHGTRFVTTSCTPHSAILRELALSADLCSAAIPLLGTRLEIPLDGPRAGARIASQCGGEPDEFRLIQVMKTLFLIRHAKSSWDDTALPDKDRPLGDRGRRDAPKMGKRLAKRDVKPDLILSSPARRAHDGGDHRQEARLQAQGYRGG